MKFNKPLYYCTECKAILAGLDKLLFIEEKSTKGFCSEACIEDFYSPLIRHFDRLLVNARTELKIDQPEKINFNLSDKEFVDQVVANPSEIWKVSNELDEEIYTYIKHFEDFSGVIVSKVYEGVASFVLLSTQTKSKQLLAELRVGERISSAILDTEVPEGFTEEDFNFMQLLENKKSVLLASLLEKRKDDDISFEDFTVYEPCFNETLESPDEVFEKKDYEGDVFFIYIKSFILESKNIFYIISCLKRKENEDSQEVNVFPVLAFPTNDLELYSEFRTGKQVASHIKN
jgi:hypothetical protein